MILRARATRVFKGLWRSRPFTYASGTNPLVGCHYLSGNIAWLLLPSSGFSHLRNFLTQKTKVPFLKNLGRIFVIVNWGAWPLILGLYLLVSLFLLVESIRQLFYLPPQAYDLPSWSSYFVRAPMSLRFLLLNP